LQWRAQAVAPRLLQPVEFADQPFVLKEMQPSADRLSLAASIGALRDLGRSVVSMAELSAWGQLRCSGRDGSATADALADYGSTSAQAKALFEQAKACETLVLQDFSDYTQAYDDGHFGKP
jgi:uncharacterized protein (DUF2252 family)